MKAKLFLHLIKQIYRIYTNDIKRFGVTRLEAVKYEIRQFKEVTK